MPIKGAWIFQSSYAYNLCGMGYGTGIWKSMSMYMKTLEAEGAVGSTIFMATTPSRYMNCAELCQGVRMPVTSSSLAHYHLNYPGGSLILKVLGAQKAGKKMLIAIPSMDWKAGPYYAWGYAVGVLSAVVCLTSTFLGLQGFAKLQKKSSFAAFIMAYECIAGFFRALLLLTSAPVGWGFAFYNGLGTNTLYRHMSTIIHGVPFQPAYGGRLPHEHEDSEQQILRPKLESQKCAKN